jgi:hypothetical protein
MEIITEKPVADRIQETLEVFNGIKTLGIPLDSPEVNELRSHFNTYIREGVCWSGTLNFLRFGRMAEVDLPRRADKEIVVRLRVPRAGR